MKSGLKIVCVLVTLFALSVTSFPSKALVEDEHPIDIAKREIRNNSNLPKNVRSAADSGEVTEFDESWSEKIPVENVDVKVKENHPQGIRVGKGGEGGDLPLIWIAIGIGILVALVVGFIAWRGEMGKRATLFGLIMVVFFGMFLTLFLVGNFGPIGLIGFVIVILGIVGLKRVGERMEWKRTKERKEFRKKLEKVGIFFLLAGMWLGGIIAMVLEEIGIISEWSVGVSGMIGAPLMLFGMAILLYIGGTGGLKD